MPNGRQALCGVALHAMFIGNKFPPAKGDEVVPRSHNTAWECRVLQKFAVIENKKRRRSQLCVVGGISMRDVRKVFHLFFTSTPGLG